MKRTLVVLALLLAVGITLTFADDAAKPAGVTIGSWARSIYAPLASRDSDTVPALGVSWGNATRVGYTIKADSDTAGFYVTLCADAHSFGVTDDIAVYVKPFPGLKIAGGSPTMTRSATTAPPSALGTGFAPLLSTARISVSTA